jgi:hypothetical protein
VSDDRTAELAKLFRAIARGESASVSRMLRASPDVARRAIAVGASREDARRWFVPEAARYVYSGDTALHFAAAAYRTTICSRLHELGADVRARNRRGAEPLHAASAGAPGGQPWNPKRQAATIELLIDAGADPDCVATGGVAPLHVAVRTRCAAAVQALLERGANPRASNDAGSTPLHLAVQTTGKGGSGSSEAKAQQTTIIRLLIDHGAQPSDKDGRGKTVAQRARGAWLAFIADIAT